MLVGGGLTVHVTPGVRLVCCDPTVGTARLQPHLSGALQLEVSVTAGGVRHHPTGASSGAKGQVGVVVGVGGVGSEVGGGGEVGHLRRLRLVLGLTAGVGGLELEGEAVALLAGRRVVEFIHKVKQRAGVSLQRLCVMVGRGVAALQSLQEERWGAGRGVEEGGVVGCKQGEAGSAQRGRAVHGAGVVLW